MNRSNALLVLLLFAFVAALSVQAWRQQHADTKAELETIIEVGANAVDMYFGQIENSLHALVEQLTEGTGQADINSDGFKNKADQLVKAFQSSHSEMRNVFVVRVGGQGLALAKRPDGVPLANIGGTDSFAEYMRTGHNKVDVGRPMKDPYFGEWIIPIRIGVNDESSNLGYFVGASLPVGFLADLWKNALAKKMPLGVMRDDGFLISRYPNLVSTNDEQLYANPRTGALVNYLWRERYPQSGFVEGINTR